MSALHDMWFTHQGSAHLIDDLEDNANDVQIVFPERLHHRRARRDTSAENTVSKNKYELFLI